MARNCGCRWSALPGLPSLTSLLTLILVLCSLLRPSGSALGLDSLPLLQPNLRLGIVVGSPCSVNLACTPVAKIQSLCGLLACLHDQCDYKVTTRGLAVAYIV